MTGANGFIGRHLVEALQGTGRTVRVLVRSADRAEGLPAGVDVRIGDVTRPLGLPEAVTGVGTVYHVAGRIRGRRADSFRPVNEEGTRSLVLACRKSAPDLDRFLLVSSMAATGPVRRGEGRPVRESDRPRPVSEYGRSKRAGEEAAFEAAAGAFPVTVVRPPVVYGPRDTGVLNFYRFADRGFRPKFTREKYYSIVHVNDLVRGMILAAGEPRAAGRIYHLANDSAPSFTRLFELIASHVGKSLRPLPLPTPLLPLIAAVLDLLSGSFGMDARPLSDKVREVMADLWVMDTSRARRELGFRTEVSLEDGFAETARSYRELGWLPTPASRV
ncbi:MAG: NAD-dependent epimerase/dehydratase family protein [Planctomycetota bacterium]